MKSFPAENVIWAVEYLTDIQVQVRSLGKNYAQKPTDILTAEFLKEAIERIRDLRAVVERSDAPVTLVAIDRIQIGINAKPCKVTYKALGEAYAQIGLRLRDELANAEILSIDSSRKGLFKAVDGPFGSIVGDVFPDAASDVSEAGKCLALGRGTAAVFHLMRAMECGVKSMSVHLGIENTDREWGKLLSDTAAKIESMPKGDKRDSWSETHTHLYHVKQAWRNSTMHPKKTYTIEEADSVYAAVRSFMKNLARQVGTVEREKG